MKQLPQGQYNYKETEQKILDFWSSKPFFKPEYNPKTGEVDSLEVYKQSTDPKWILVCPPPNAYDRPHMGNLSGYPYMDALARYHRLDGKRVLVIPGKDHAGIEGEISYIKYMLEPQGKGKFDFTREEFYQNVWEMQQNYRASIQQDEKNIGLSADFDRDLYTLDPEVVDEVLGTFIQMYQDGLVYKGVRIVNWDPKSQSSISDSQCERKEQMGKLYYIKYKLVESESYLMVATTRPETMLGDTALVVNPTDKRYKHLVGKKVIVPLTNREIPIITSGRIEKDFGTGVLKLTPAHAPEDYEIMIEWNTMVESLERDNPTVFDSVVHQKVDYLNIIDRYTKLCGPIPEKYIGLKVNPAREAVVADLKEAGYIEKEEDLMQNLLISERTGAVIEPIMSSQWYIDVSGLKQKLIDIVTNGDVKIYPKSAEKRYFAWVNNLRDWAISRNLWWGYRLPVWYNGQMIERINEAGKIQNFLIQNGEEIEFDPQNSEHMRVQQDKPGENWIQDDEILDTWFSSGQWPYLCLKSAGLLEQNYPTDAMVSGYDLLIKWDLTMMLFSIYKTGTVPFKNLYLTGLVKGTDGQKMSKSKRNFVPIDDVKEQYGIDAFRMNCFYQNKAGRAYAITPETLKAFRNFNNKLWNASKFVMMNLEGIDHETWFEELRKISTATEYKLFTDRHPELHLEEEDSLMVAKLQMVESNFKVHFEKYRFGMLSEELYNEFWHTFCDLYIEQTKGRVWKDRETGEYKSTQESRKAAQATLFYTLKSFLKMLHPFVPFVTEEIWQHLVEDGAYDVAMMYRK